MKMIISESEVLRYFDAIDVGIHIIDKDGVTLFYSKAAERIDGIPAEQMLGKSMVHQVCDGLFSCSTGLMALEQNDTVTKTQEVNGRLILSTAVPIRVNGMTEKVIVSIRDIDQLKHLEEQIRSLRDENLRLNSSLGQLNSDFLTEHHLLHKSKAMDRVVYLADRLATVDSTVLLEGESGVGKGMVARYIHDQSNRKNRPFVTVDCSSIPESLFESELFGYREGAFTGALTTGKEGLVMGANTGTLFLDEIGELPLSIQAKLLRLLQNKEIQPIGAPSAMKVDVRIISATNWDLQQQVEKKMFREDLYYRLRVVPVHIPPLRYRQEDIVPLIKLFMNKFNHYYNQNCAITPRALNALLAKPWPGNVRELENEIERLLVTCDEQLITENDVLGQAGVHWEPDTDSASESMRVLVERYEMSLLHEYKRKSRSVKEMAFRAKMNESTLRKKAERLGISLYFGNNSTDND
jgi:PAS domain S-box-containing protein